MSIATVKEMCEGCGWKRRSSCKVITDPKWIFNHRKGNCFAKVTPEKAEEIENNLSKRRASIERRKLC